MWLFTKYGFFSAVCARKTGGALDQPIDLDRIMVRARTKSHLEALLTRFPDHFGGCNIMSFAGSDYAYRIFVDKSTWSQVVAALSEEMDYDNFKAEVGFCQGRSGRDYEHALHEVWGVMRGLQKCPPRTVPPHSAMKG